MTDQDDELKKLFQEKNLENAFTPDEKNWEKMSFYLQNERKRRKRFLIYFSLLLGLGSGIYLALLSLREAPATKLVQKQNEGVTETNTSANTAGKLKLLETKVPKETTTAGSPKMRIKTPTDASTPHSITKAPETSEQQPGQTPSDQEIPGLLKETPTLPATKATHALQPLPEENEPGLAASPLPKPEMDPSHPHKDIEEVKRDPDTKKEHSVSSDEGFSKMSDLPADTANSGLSGSPAEERSKQMESEAPDLVPALTPEKISADALSIKPFIEPAGKPDLTIPPVIPVNDSIFSGKTYRAGQLFLEAGFNYMLGWKTYNTREANGINPLAGLHYHRNLNRKAGFSIGIGYSTVNNLTATSHTSTTTRVKFGEEVDMTVISATKMHYLLIPLKLDYRLSRNDVVCIGYTMAYLLDVNSNIESYSTGLNYANAPGVSKSMGYTKGFNPYDGQVTFCYRRRLYRECYLNGEFYYGIRDIKDNRVYAIDAFERSIGFRLSLGINLF